MQRLKPELTLIEIIEDIARRASSPSIELALVQSVSPIVIVINGTVIRYDIKRLAGTEYAAGDTVAVELIGDDYMIIGKVVDA